MFEKKRFIAPPQDNAFEIYQKVLRIDPQQTHALSQINKIKSNYYDNIKLHLKNYQLAEAEKEIDTCKGVFGSDQELLASEKEYDEKLKSAESIPIKIEILNGAGVSGIAYTLSNYLKNEKYSIVLRENYRVNGQIHWNVKNTQLIGSIPINKRVKRLEQILNVEYERNVLKNRQSRQANILIIIGKDYDKINPLK